MKIISANFSNTQAPADNKLTSVAAQPAELQSVEVDAQVLDLGDTMSDSDVDMARVAQLRLAIESGSFQISSQSIYDGLAASVQELQDDGAVQ